MIRRVLLACRGEIAHRFIRTARRLGIETLAVHDGEEEIAPFVLAATHRIRSATPNPYASQDILLALAAAHGANAIATGYGPLAENADFAQACVDAGLIFVGPSARALRLTGDKIQARQLAISVGVPVIPGAPAVSLNAAKTAAAEIGYPILIKAANGGGGRGIRLVETPGALAPMWKEVEREATAAFGGSDLYVERFLGEHVRHVEIQVLGDTTGNVVALGDRGCSVQRRRQKIVEEAPAPDIAPALRAEMSAAAVRFARAAGYTSAGTVEFLVDRVDRYYFIEMNGRIQVEHPVTEAVTGLDIVQAMFEIAAGRALDLNEVSSPEWGHAIEFRICAEDPLREFLPTGGLVTACDLPHGPGVRIDSGIAAGLRQPTRYDSLCAKVIVWGRDRAEALGRGKGALGELTIAGLATNIPFHRWLMDNPSFIDGGYNLSIAADYRPAAPNETTQRDAAIAVALRAHLTVQTAPVNLSAHPAISRWRLINEKRTFNAG